MELNYIECLAAIITYNPGISKLKRNIEAIFSLQDKIDILIVDNASKNIDDILTLISAYNSVQIIKNEKNEGIAYALNQAAQEAEERGLKWVLTCDQDSVMPSNSLSEYKKAFDIDDVALVCPIVYDSNAGRYLDYKKTNESFTEVKGCITSGSLVKVNAWRDVDGFDADMFIDGVDFDFCYRLCEKGYKIIMNCPVAAKANGTVLLSTPARRRLTSLSAMFSMKSSLYSLLHISISVGMRFITVTRAGLPIPKSSSSSKIKDCRMKPDWSTIS